jgi:DNA repair exonuclease SbcCD nuclease subunit
VRALDSRIAQVLRDATFRAWERVIDLAIEERADLLLVAGDVYDGADRSLRAQLRFREALRRAAGAGITCLVAHGNHDPLSGWEAQLALPERVHRFGGAAVEQFTVRRDGEVLARVYGISFPVREVKDNLVLGFPRPEAGPFAIGVLHCNVGGNPQYDNYAPCTVQDLLGCRLDYWALGHIHTPQVLRESDPCIAYPGNTQGRSVRELGPRGCYLVRVDPAGRLSREFVAIDVVRWFSRDLDIGGLQTWDEFWSALEQTREEVRASAQGRAAILRLHLSGRGELHSALRRIDPERDLAAALREGEAAREDFVWVEGVHNRTRTPLDLTQRRQVQDFVGDFLTAAENLHTAKDLAAELRQVLNRRPEHKVIARLLEQLTETDLEAVLGDAETLGVDLLLPEEG